MKASTEAMQKGHLQSPAKPPNKAPIVGNLPIVRQEQRLQAIERVRLIVLRVIIGESLLASLFWGLEVPDIRATLLPYFWILDACIT